MNCSLQNLDISFKQYNSDATLHMHQYHQLVLARSGRMEIAIDGHFGVIDPRQGAFISSNSSHEFCCADGGIFVVLDISSQASASLLCTPEILSYLNDKKFFLITNKIEYLINYAVADHLENNRLMILNSWANLVMAEIVDFSACRLSAKSQSIHRAIEYINNNFSKKITVDMIAKQAGVSERSLHVLFVDVLNTKPHAYVMETRMRHAMFLLSTTQKSVSEVAFLAGYADQSALSRSMQKCHGTTPALYRRSTPQAFRSAH